LEPVTEQGAVADEAEASAFSPKDIALFAVRATRENLVFCVLIALAVAFIGSTVVSALPVFYDATSKIFIQDSGTLTSTLASGRERYRPIEGTRGLQEFILARDNLQSIVREAKLFDNWPKTRPWPMRIKDSVQSYLLGPPDRKGMERVFVDMLSTSISAAKEEDSIRIHAQWRDPESAYSIARLVQRNFLQARAEHDLGPIQRAIPFLEEQLREADQEIESAIARIQAAATSAAPEPTAPKPAEAPKPGAAAASASLTADLANLTRQLSDIRRQQRALTEFRRQRLSELKMQLLDMKASYSDEHPLIRQQEARIASMNEVPEEVAALREKEAQLLSSLASRGIARPATEPGAAAAARQPAGPDAIELAPLQARLGSALRKSDEMVARLEGTRIELATAEADFKHRYVVVEEAEISRTPLKPKKQLFGFLGVFVAALVLGIGAGTLRELRRGRLVELWQVRALGIELLGEVNLK
jgi:uncharacterized protein involved in exopolysaccharide biosynthesis